MSAAPITAPVRVLTTALYAALSPLVGVYAGVPACYWLKAVQGAAEALLAGELDGVIIFQAQAPIRDGGYIDDAEATGTIVVKAIAATDDAAQDLLESAVAALAAGLSAPAGYAVQLEWADEPVIPPLNGLYTAAASYRATIRRAP